MTPFGETKVYYDGSHYIAIPKTSRHKRARPKPPEEVQINEGPENAVLGARLPHTAEVSAVQSDNPGDIVKEKVSPRTLKTEYTTTRKELFNKLYNEHQYLPKAKRRAIITAAMRPYFKNRDSTADYVGLNIRRKINNVIARRTRCLRKANLQEFNYFVTFTYDGKLHTEEGFIKKIKSCLGHFCSREGWKYIAVRERSPEKKRLHFHGIFNIPEGTMPGLLFEKNDYSFGTHKRQITVQNTYFNDNFGRSDFDEINDRNRLGEAVGYLLKYIEKTGQRIIYSKGLPQYFISDVMDDDIVCKIGQEDKKLLLFDDFNCWDEGCLTGRVSGETIKQMRTKT